MRDMANTITNGQPPTATPDVSAESVADRTERRVASGELTLSEMGRKMLAARRRVEQSGILLLDEEGVLRERAERRGGV